MILLTHEDADPADLMLARSGRSTAAERKKGRQRKHPEQVNVLAGADNDNSLRRERPGEGQNDDSELRSRLENLRYIKKMRDQSAKEEENMRVWQRPNDARLDWRMLLNHFIQEEICDYSFMPPDRRLQDSDLFLPDFNEADVTTKEILFAVDASGSVEDEMLDTVYAELAGMLEQFQNKIQGVLASFDTQVYKPARFSEIDDLEAVIS